MIKSIKFNMNDKYHSYTPNAYAASLESIKSVNGVIEFSDGLNIIVGPNGSGKSTILNAIAHHMAANLTGYSIISESWLSSLDKDTLEGAKPKLLNVIHDGTPALYCNPRVGINGLSRHIKDGEFFAERGLDAFFSSCESSGEKTNRLLTPLMHWMQNPKLLQDEIPFAFNPETSGNALCESARSASNFYLQGQLPKSKTTIILDEPESGLSILNQILLWRSVLANPEFLNNFQIILVSHSYECLDIPGANYIELKPGYLDACRNALKGQCNLNEMKQAATKLTIKLSTKQINLLKRLKNGEGEIKCTDSKLQQELLDANLVEAIRKRIKRKEDGVSKSSLERRSLSAAKHYYHLSLTDQGHQYLLIHDTTLS